MKGDNGRFDFRAALDWEGDRKNGARAVGPIASDDAPAQCLNKAAANC
jgi:hypothetical protein